MACRNPGRCETVAKKIREDEIVLEQAKTDRGVVDPESASDIATMAIDTSSLKSVKKFCEDHPARTDDGEGSPKPLDVLFLNAGIIHCSGPFKLTEDGIEKGFATSVVGHHLMCRLLEPSICRPDGLRKAPARIVQTSSAASHGARHPYKVATDLESPSNEEPIGFGPHGTSKLAQILWAREFTAQLDATATNSSEKGDQDPNSIVHASAAHPGAVATSILLARSFDELPFGLGKPAPAFLEFPSKFIWTCDEGALTLLYLGTATEDLQTKNIRGRYFHPQSIMIGDHRLASDKDPNTKILQEKLWKFLDELVTEFL